MGLFDVFIRDTTRSEIFSLFGLPLLVGIVNTLVVSPILKSAPHDESDTTGSIRNALLVTFAVLGAVYLTLFHTLSQVHRSIVNDNMV